ncbi:MAG: hypothetical protein ABIP20_12930 [Chthoniobacteraceae bacterium]
MKSLPTFSPKPCAVRFATLLLASLLLLGATVQTASAGDALTSAVVGATGPARKGLMRSLFGDRRTADSTPVSAMDRVNRSILGLPLGILRSVGKGVSKMALRTVTDHVSHAPTTR